MVDSPSPESGTEKNLLNTGEAAVFLDLKSPRTLEVWRVKKKGPKYVKVGGHVRYRRVELEAWLDKQTVETR